MRGNMSISFSLCCLLHLSHPGQAPFGFQEGTMYHVANLLLVRNHSQIIFVRVCSLTFVCFQVAITANAAATSRQESAKSITLGWNPTFAPTLSTWQPKELAPAKGHLVMEINFRDPAQRPSNWSYAGCVTWLERNPRKDGQERLPAMPTIFQTPVQDHSDGKLRNFQVYSVMFSPHRRRS